MFKEVAKELRQLFDKNGIDPIYAITIGLLILILIFDYSKIKKWATVKKDQKAFVRSHILVLIFFIILSLLNLLGILYKKQ
jgi:hypothetical protein